MHTIRPFLFAVSISMASGAWIFSDFGISRVSAQDGSKKAISAEALSRGDFEIIGRLGKPYGEISQVRAVWEREYGNTPKPPGLVFRVTHVDGRELAKEKQIEVLGLFMGSWIEPGGGKPIEPGDVFEGRVYESGGYVRAPAKVDEMRGEPKVADPFGFKFYSFVYYIDEESFLKLRAAEGTRAIAPKPVEPGRVRER